VLNLVMELCLLVSFLGAGLTIPLLDVGRATAVLFNVVLPEVTA